MTIALVLIIAALICGLLSLLGVSSRVDLNAVAVVLLSVALLLGMT